MANSFYDHTTYPANGSALASATMRAELDAVEAGFDKLPTLAGNGTKLVRVNAGGTALEVTSGVSGDLVGTTDTQALTNKTFVIASNTVTTAASGNLAATELNAALSELQADIDSRAKLDTIQSWSAAQTFNTSNVKVKGSSTGVTALASANASATDYTATLPAATMTVAGLSVAQSWTAEQTFKELKDTVYTITDGAAFEIDPGNGSVQLVTLGNNRTPAATNFEAGQIVMLGIDDGTAYAVTWTTVAPTWVKAGGTATAPTLATTGYTWVLLWKVGSVIYGAEVGKP